MSVIIHILEFMAIVGIPIQIETNNVTAYISSKIKLFLHITTKIIRGILHNPTEMFVKH